MSLVELRYIAEKVRETNFPVPLSLFFKPRHGNYLIAWHNRPLEIITGNTVSSQLTGRDGARLVSRLSASTQENEWKDTIAFYNTNTWLSAGLSFVARKKKVPAITALPGDNGEFRWIHTRSHEKYHVLVTGLAKCTNLKLERVQLFFRWVFDLNDFHRDFAVPVSPKNKNKKK